MYRFASLPEPKETDWELELPDEQSETNGGVELSEEDAAERDRRNQILRDAAEAADFSRRTQVLQRALPRPSVVDIDALMKSAFEVSDPGEGAIAKEMALLIANDALKYPISKTKVQGASRPLQSFDDEALSNARLEIAMEMQSAGAEKDQEIFDSAWSELHESSSVLPGLASYEDDEVSTRQVLTEAFDVRSFPSQPSHHKHITKTPQNIQNSITADAEKGNKLEKKLALHYGGYQQRAKTLRLKITEAAEALDKERVSLDTFRTLQVAERAALPGRLEALGEEVRFVRGRERDAQEVYRLRREELGSVRRAGMNGGG